MRRAVLTLVLVGLALSLAAKQVEKSYWAQRFDVTADVMGGGNLQVHEQVDFVFRGGPFTYVFRELPTQATDGIVDIVARVDGRTLPEGDGPGQVEIEYGDPIRVTWHMEPTSNTIRSFDLYYRMLGVVRKESNSDLLWWRPLPAEHEYTIASNQTVIKHPPRWRSQLQPTVEQGEAWIEVESGRVSFRASRLGPNESYAIEVPFISGSVLSGPPTWQAEQYAADVLAGRQAWMWLALGLLTIVGGVGLLFATLTPYRRQVRQISGLAYEPPGDMAPAIAGALRSSAAAVSWAHALGTLFDLASRGYLVIEQLPKRRWTGDDFLIQRLETSEQDRDEKLRPHEASLMALLLVDKDGLARDSVKVSALNNLISSSRWKRFEKSIKGELIAAGLLSEARKNARGRIIALSLVPMALMLGTAVILVAFYSQVGLWPLALIAALLILAIAWLIGGGSISALSDTGAQRAAEWEPFYRYLKSVSKGNAAPANEGEFESYLPFVTAYGLLHAWAKRFEKRGWTETPAYFRPLEGAGQLPMAAFVAMAAATSSSGGSASSSAVGVAGGAGAAGGGASGAG